MTHYDRLRDPDGSAEAGKVVGKVGDLVSLGWPVTSATSAEIEPGDGVRLGEMVELRSECRVVAAPTVDKEQLWVVTACPLVVQPQTAQLGVRHSPAILA